MDVRYLAPKRKADARVAAVIAEEARGLEDAYKKLDAETRVSRVQSATTQNHDSSAEVKKS
ncbi:hypothetical protein BM221_003164 [Beauveria bassiana]|uniref:Uncharacterized protein n=1 Tax=Beauveria bassiana TaxID=176275 RepID=A0A2N6NTX3_BEABA|nr:hypothetical protein BM221_003164 [Beauveria bassiana]